MGYQLKQVRERLAKGLVDKGVLRTEKKNFLIFDMATHPVSDKTIKEEIIARVVSCLLGIGPAPSLRTVCLVCSAYAGNVLENALVHLSHSQREASFTRAEELLQQYAKAAKADPGTEIISGVCSVFSKMDSVLY